MAAAPPVRPDHLRARTALRRLGLLSRAAGWITDTGLLAADLDLAAVRLADGQPARRRLASALRRTGYSYNPRRHRIHRTGPSTVEFPYTYLGANDRAGPNYTGQPAIASYYTDNH